MDMIGNGRALTRCDQCGQLDDHPKSHGPGLTVEVINSVTTARLETVHHDCLRANLVEVLALSAQAAATVPATKIVEMCQGGKKGSALLEAIYGAQPKHKASTILATTFANDVLDDILPNGASGTYTVGGTTYTLPARVIFLTTLSTAGTQGNEWATGGGYTNSSGGGATGGVPINGQFTSAASAAAKANTGAITVTNAPAGTWADNEVHDSTATTQKRIAAKGTPSLAKTVNSGDTCTIPIGSLTGSLT